MYILNNFKTTSIYQRWNLEKNRNVLKQYRQFSCYFLLILIFSIISLFFLQEQRFQNLRKEDAVSRLSTLSQTVDAELKNACASVIQFTNEPDLLGYTSRTERNLSLEAKISYYIYLSTKTNENISNYYLYYPQTNVILASHSAARLSDYSPFYNVLTAYNRQAVNIYNIAYLERYGALFCFDSHYYLVYEIPKKSENTLGLAFAQLNIDNMMELFSDSTAFSSQMLYIIDSEGNLVYENQTKTFQKLSDEGITQKQNKNYRNVQIIHHLSPFSGWTYYCSYPVYTAWDMILAALLKSLPVLLFTGGFFLLLIYYFHLRIASPIAQILSELPDTGQDHQLGHDDSEFDRISGSFHLILDGNHHMNEIFKRMQPEIQQLLFNRLLTNSSIDLAETQQLLTDLGFHYQFSDRIILQLLLFDGSPEQKNAAYSLLPLIMQKSRLKATRTKIHRVDGTQTLIFLLVRQEESSITINRECFELLKANYMGSGLPMPVIQNCICYSLLDIHSTYLHLLENVDALPSKSDTEPGKSHFLPSSQSLSNYVKAIASQIMSGKTEAAFATISSRLDASLAEDSGSGVPNTSQFLNGIMKLLMDFGVTEQEPVFLKTETLMTEQTSLAVEELKSLFREAIFVCSNYYKKAQNKYIVAAKTLVEKHYNNPSLSLSMIADEIGIHPNYLSKLFKSNIQQNFIDYLRNYRIMQARETLAHSALPINEVAESVGFSSPQAFIRVFKNTVGCTPGQYRKKQSSTK